MTMKMQISACMQQKSWRTSNYRRHRIRCTLVGSDMAVPGSRWWAANARVPYDRDFPRTTKSLMLGFRLVPAELGMINYHKCAVPGLQGLFISGLYLGWG